MIQVKQYTLMHILMAKLSVEFQQYYKNLAIKNGIKIELDLHDLMLLTIKRLLMNYLKQ